MAAISAKAFPLLVTVLFWGLCPAALPGATITVTNFNGPESQLLGRDNGSPLTRGVVWLGTFHISGDAVRQAVSNFALAHLEEQFVQFGNATGVFFNGLPGLYQDVVTQTVAEGDAFAGRHVYTVVSEGGVMSEPGQLLIFQHEQVFLPDPSRIEPALLSEGEGELLVGEFGRFRGNLGQIQDQPMFTLARVIPEPSTASFVLLAFAFLCRRRRS